MKNNPFNILGITPEVARRVRKDALKEIIQKQKASLLACFHPDSSIAPDRQKFQEVSDAFDAIDPSDPNSNFDIYYERLKNPHKQRKNAIEDAEVISDHLARKLETTMESLRNVMIATVFRTTEKKDSHLSTDVGLVSRINTLDLPKEVYVMARYPYDAPESQRNSGPQFFGVLIQDGICHFFHEKKIEMPHQNQLENGEQIIRKGKSFFLLTPLHHEGVHRPIGSTSSSFNVGTKGDNTAVTRIGSTTPKNVGAQEGFSHADFLRALAGGFVFTPNIELNKTLLTTTTTNDGEPHFHTLGSISRISLPQDFRMNQIHVISGANRFEDKWHIDATGIMIVENQGQHEAVYTLEKFTEEQNIDINNLTLAIRGLDITPLPLKCSYGEKRGIKHVYRLQSLLQVSEHTVAKDGFVHYCYKEPRKRAIHSEGFLELCKTRQPHFTAAAYYPLLERSTIRAVTKAFCTEFDTTYGATKEVFDVDDLESLYNIFAAQRRSNIH